MIPSRDIEMRKKLFRLTTVDLSLDKLIEGQLRHLSGTFDVTAVASDTGLLQKVAKREGVRVIDVPLKRNIAPMHDLRSLWTLYRLMRRERPHIVHCNTPKGSLLGLMAARLAGVRHRLYTVTGLRYQGATGAMRTLLMTMERVTCRCATRVIPEGEGVKKTLIADHITAKSLEVIYHGNINGIDTARFDPDNAEVASPSLPWDDNGGHKFTFVFVGRIARDKGMHELVASMRRLPEVRLIVVGSYDNTDPIDSADRQFIETSPQVAAVGWHDDVRPYLKAADALVFPSYREGFPNVPMQAGAMCKASIVTDINGCNEIIINGENGSIVAARDADALTQAMQHFASHPAEVAEMGKKARGLIKSRYEQADVWNALTEMYNAL